MVRYRGSWLLAVVVILGGVGGCCCPSGNRRTGYMATTGPIPMPSCDRCAANGPLPPLRVAPGAPAVPPGVAAPPGAVIVPPAGPGPAAPPASQSAPPIGSVPPSPPSDGPIQQNGYTPPPAGSSAPSAVTPGVYLEQPQPVGPAPSRPPQAPAAPPAEETRPYTPQTPEPPAAPRDDRGASPEMPVSIPRFAMVKPNVASGQEPFAEGIVWLKNHGYRTVLYVRAPGEDDGAARRRVEQTGLRYLSLEVSAQTLSRETVEQFNRLIADPANLPLFVYDRDGSLAGGLWYLHFRLADRVDDEKAREEVARLGFRQDQDGAHRTMWVAVQNLLDKLK